MPSRQLPLPERDCNGAVSQVKDDHDRTLKFARRRGDEFDMHIMTSAGNDDRKERSKNEEEDEEESATSHCASMDDDATRDVLHRLEESTLALLNFGWPHFHLAPSQLPPTNRTSAGQ
ncbi:hypothetical protein M514_04086 [Trichuris suis]|uniref:Uncharacterized protein n=1 Tax=Trichuris suis TaxID=68888 RepID=A0A085MCF8_9BILA|nr:hypothetical protein M513_04086 [Trichuris suis]KFD68383.1 hypothetical protein M514_04086 [Trichuris suis]